MLRLLTVIATVLLTAVPAAHAGTVTRTADAVTYEGAGGNERVEVGYESDMALVFSELGVTTEQCTVVDPQSVQCAPGARFVVRLLGGDDSISAASFTGPMSLLAYGGGGSDGVSGTAFNDELFGEDGSDAIDGRAGDDLIDGGADVDSLEGGAGNDTIRGGDESDSISGGDGSDAIDAGAGDDYSIDDGPGDDTVVAGPGNDSWKAGTGRDTFAAGDGLDRVDYEGRGAGVTITLAGGADDGESGEGDDVGTAAEEAVGGPGPDRIAGNGAGNTLIGGAGDDSITGGSADDRIEGGPGNDVIDARDGRYDSIDCGEGSDTVYGDPGDGTVGCEIAPDADGDGHDAAVDCAPLDPLIHPGAGEVPGNAIDEDCNGGPQYLRVDTAISYFGRAQRRRPYAVRFSVFRTGALLAGDRVEVRCKGGRRRGCAFRVKRYAITTARSRLNVVSAFKRRAVRPGATIEVRIMRENWIGKAVRLRVSRKGKLRTTPLCIPVGATAPAACA